MRIFQATAAATDPDAIRGLDLSDVLEANPIFSTFDKAIGYHGVEHAKALRDLADEDEEPPTEDLDWAQVCADVWEASSDLLGVVYRVTACNLL